MDNQLSCIVATSALCNYATRSEPLNLQILSMKVLQKYESTSGVTNRSSISCTVASTVSRNYATNTLIKLISKIGLALNEDENFLEVYTNEVISNWSNNMEVAIACFTDLIPQLPLLKTMSNNPNE